MTDLELAEYLGIADDARWPKAIANLDPTKRAGCERMHEVENEIALWQAGVGARPTGVLMDFEKGHKGPR
jgi:hypothetical protein